PPEGGPYQVSIDPYREGTAPPQGGAPGSNSELLRRHALEEPVADYAILLPLTRGYMLDPRLEAAIAAGTNEWLADRWLGSTNQGGRLKGTIRISPRRPHDAIKEIERWSEHGHFVQVAVPLETHVLYGDEVYFEIWKAAAERQPSRSRSRPRRRRARASRGGQRPERSARARSTARFP